LTTVTCASTDEVKRHLIRAVVEVADRESPVRQDRALLDPFEVEIQLRLPVAVLGAELALSALVNPPDTDRETAIGPPAPEPVTVLVSADHQLGRLVRSGRYEWARIVERNMPVGVGLIDAAHRIEHAVSNPLELDRRDVDSVGRRHRHSRQYPDARRPSRVERKEPEVARPLLRVCRR